MRVGFHTSRAALAATIKQQEITAAQLFLGSPRSWSKPAASSITEGAGLAQLDCELYVHSGYLLNPASAKDAVRASTVRALQAELDNAAALGARGLVLHGGQGGKDAALQETLARWVECLKQVEVKVPLLIENTAGGTAAPARHLDSFGRLWEAVKPLGPIGYCVDTCHAWAGGFGLEGLHQRLLALTGEGPTLVHLNGSEDACQSGRDRHANLVREQRQTELALDYCRQAKAPVILETPGHRFASDLSILKAELASL